MTYGVPKVTKQIWGIYSYKRDFSVAIDHLSLFFLVTNLYVTYTIQFVASSLNCDNELPNLI